LGMPDAYPFALAPPVVEKLRFVHRVIEAAGKAQEGVKPDGAVQAQAGARSATGDEKIRASVTRSGKKS
jgi:hypothetical protein